MSDDGKAARAVKAAGRGVAGGFFGCLGALAALFCVLVAVATCSQIRRDEDEAARAVAARPAVVDARLQDWARAGEADRFAVHCRTALEGLVRRNRGLAAIQPSAGEGAAGEGAAIVEARMWPVVSCAGVSAGQAVTARVAVSCADGADPACVTVERASVGGLALKVR